MSRSQITDMMAAKPQPTHLLATGASQHPILPIAATNQLNRLAALLLHWVVDHPVVTNVMSFLSVSPQLPNASHLINTNF